MPADGIAPLPAVDHDRKDVAGHADAGSASDGKDLLCSI